jgi:L-fuculose-phosphate aldolase
MVAVARHNDRVMTEIQLRAAICEVGRRLWQRGLIGSTEGNISARLSPRQILCTPAGVSKGHMKPDDVVVVDLSGKVVKGEAPSCEINLHLTVYKNRKDCEAIVHAHPPVTGGFCLAGEEIPDNLMPEAAVQLGSVAIVPFAMPGTEAVAQAVEPFLEDHKTFLLSHHGALVLGKDLWDACNRMEALERVATMLLNAKLLGGARPIPEDAFDYLLEHALNGRLE